MPERVSWRNLKANIPTIKVITNANKLFTVNTFGEDKSLISKINAPKDAGIKRENEKLKASIGAKPTNKAAKIVEPERDMAGIMAKAWNKPIKMAFL